MNCNICNSIDLKLEFVSNDIQYYRCNQCNYFKRIPDTSFLSYCNDYISDYHLEKSRRLAKSYYNKMKNIIPQGSKCLELGGSFGFFCKELQTKLNCEVRNIELSIHAANYANSNGVMTFDDIEKLDILDFDFIFSFHVLEHLEPKDIIQFIFKALSKLKDNGEFHIFTPNADSLKLKIFKNHFAWLAPEEHISFLSSKAIKIIEISGIDIKTISQIPALEHYPLNSFIFEIRKRLLKRNFNENTNQNSYDNQQSKRTEFIKKIFHTIIKVEKYFLLPFYLVIDLIANKNSYDELYIVLKKIPKRDFL